MTDKHPKRPRALVKARQVYSAAIVCCAFSSCSGNDSLEAGVPTQGSLSTAAPTRGYVGWAATVQAA